VEVRNLTSKKSLLFLATRWSAHDYPVHKAPPHRPACAAADFIPPVSFDLIERVGYRLAFLSDVLLGSAFAAYDHALRQVRDAAHGAGVLQLPHIAPAREIFRRLGAEHWDALRAS
jgi:hypothetical protein